MEPAPEAAHSRNPPPQIVAVELPAAEHGRTAWAQSLPMRLGYPEACAASACGSTVSGPD